MADLDERVTRLEERSDAHTRMMEQVLTGMSELRGEIAGLRNEMTAFRGEIRQDIAELRTSMERRFTWLVGIQVAGLVAVIGALVGAYFR